MEEDPDMAYEAEVEVIVEDETADEVVEIRDPSNTIHA